MENTQKVLIVTYYWPPSGGPGVQRWLKFAKYLPDFGWEPIIYTPENPSYPLIDETLVAEIPNDIKVIKKPIWEPYQLAEKLSKSNKKYKGGQFDVGKNQSLMSKISIFIRGNFFIPDARKFWVNPSINFLKKHLQDNKIDVLVTTGPPHSLHLIGLGLKKELKQLKWIADFRDPWTEISYYKHLKLTKLADAKHKALEKSVFENADITLATSFTDADNFKKQGAKSLCITNGFDTEPIINSTTKTDFFTLSYVGVLEQLRNPEKLWNVLKELCEEDKNFARDFQLKFVGRIDDKILESLESSVLKQNINNLGYLAHKDSVKEMQNSDILLITNFPKDSSRGIIPGKLFEYLATGKKIISFGPKYADVEKILGTTNAGKHFDYYQHSDVKKYIYTLYKEWLNNEQFNNSTNIKNFSRKELTKQLSEILNNL